LLSCLAKVDFKSHQRSPGSCKNSENSLTARTSPVLKPCVLLLSCVAVCGPRYCCPARPAVRCIRIHVLYACKVERVS